MSELIFEHDGWTVVTSAWTAASKGADKIVLCYPWSSFNGFSAWGDSATGVAHLEIPMSMSDFIKRTGVSDRADLRVYQRQR